MKNLFGILIALSWVVSCVEKNTEPLLKCKMIYIASSLTLKFEVKSPLDKDFKLFLDGNEVPKFCPPNQTPCISQVLETGNSFSLVVVLDPVPSNIDVRLTEGALDTVRVEQIDVLPVGIASTDECVDEPKKFEASLVEAP